MGATTIKDKKAWLRGRNGMARLREVYINADMKKRSVQLTASSRRAGSTPPIMLCMSIEDFIKVFHDAANELLIAQGRKKPKGKIDEKQVIQLYLKGWRPSAIALKFDTDLDEVSEILRRHENEL